MPQNALPANVGLKPNNQTAPLRVDSSGRLLTNGAAASSTLGITSATVVLSGGGTIQNLQVVNGGTSHTEGFVYDAAAVSGSVTSNLIAGVPTIDGGAVINFPVNNGILVVPGTSQTIAVTFTPKAG